MAMLREQYDFLLIYPASGRATVGPVEKITAEDIEPLVYSQVKQRFVKVIRLLPANWRHYPSAIVVAEELIYDNISDQFIWKDVKELQS